VNRQVPKKYTIIGDGKMAKHIIHYFNILGIDCNQWHRQQSHQILQKTVVDSDYILLLISDDAIDTFTQEHSYLQRKTLIHFSGSLISENAFGCHPLMTFGDSLYDLSIYKSMPFVCDDNVDFKSLFPQLNNTFFNLERSHKAYYHALCVIAGNFSQTLMRDSSQLLTNNFNLPKDILHPYLLQNVKNFIANSNQSITGPIQRNDSKTINSHLLAIKDQPLEGLYLSFLRHANLLGSITHEY